MAKKRKSSKKKSSSANRQSTVVKRVAPFLTVERLHFAGEITLIRLAEALSKPAKNVDDPEAVSAAAAAFERQAAAARAENNTRAESFANRLREQLTSDATSPNP